MSRPALLLLVLAVQAVGDVVGRDEPVTTHRFQRACRAVALDAGQGADVCLPWNVAGDADALGAAPQGWCAVAAAVTPVAEPIRVDGPPVMTPHSACVRVLNTSYNRAQTATLCCYGYRAGSTP